MANIEHKDLTEANLHQCKGVSTATAGSWQRAKGDGTTEWIARHAIKSKISTYTGVLTAYTWNDITWDSDLYQSGITRSGASFTVARTGIYHLGYTVNIKTDPAYSPLKYEARLVNNGTELDGSGWSIEQLGNTRIPVTYFLWYLLTAGDVIKFQLYPHAGSGMEPVFVGTQLSHPYSGVFWMHSDVF